MFTAKFYGPNGRRVIHEAESFTILSLTNSDGSNSRQEITLHRANGDDMRINLSDEEPATDDPPRYQRAIIENANGKTTEILQTPMSIGQPF